MAATRSGLVPSRFPAFPSAFVGFLRFLSRPARAAQGRGAALLALLILASAGHACAQSCAGMSLGSGANLNGFLPFPASNAWNTNIAAAPLDPQSPAITSAEGFAGLHLHVNFGSSTDDGGIPYVVVDSTATPSVPINVIDYADQSDVVVAPYPPNAPIEGAPVDCSGWPDTYNGDAHVLVLDRARCELYETFNTNRCQGKWDASSETIWDMSNGESRPWGWTSADAAGLPIFPGLVRYEEVASGAINHAIRFTMQVTKNDTNGGYFVEPASHAAGVYWGVSNIMGMRVRLKAGFDISGFSKTNQIILTAMKKYGMILADNGGYFFVQGAIDPRWDDNDLSNLNVVGSENFEVVKMTPAFPGWDSATAPSGAIPVIHNFTASAASVISGTPVTFSYTASGDSYDFIDAIGPVKAGSGSVTISPTATQTYTFNSTNAYGRATSAPLRVTVLSNLVAAPAFTPPGGFYDKPQKVTMATVTSPAATIYYTTNGATPTTHSPVFSAANPVAVAASETLKAMAVVKGYAAPSAVSLATYVITSPTAVPLFSVKAGTYPAVQSLALSDATAGAAIYYTTNGTAPTTASRKYTGALAISSAETVEAFAVAAGFTNSAVASEAFRIVGSPTALAAPANPVGASSATLNAIVNTFGINGSYQFQYGGSSSALSASTASTPLSASASPVAISAPLAGLAKKTKYYYRVLVTTAGGTASGAVLAFTTN